MGDDMYRPFWRCPAEANRNSVTNQPLAHDSTFESLETKAVTQVGRRLEQSPS